MTAFLRTGALILTYNKPDYGITCMKFLSTSGDFFDDKKKLGKIEFGRSLWIKPEN